MRVLAGVVVMLSMAIAHAAPPPKTTPSPDTTIVWQEGEMSRDMSIWTTTITITGTKVHYTTTYAGRFDGMQSRPKPVDGVVKDPKKLATALAALDKTPVKPVKARETSENQVSGCIQRGKQSRCANHIGKEPETEEFKAIAAIKAAAIEGLNVSPQP